MSPKSRGRKRHRPTRSTAGPPRTPKYEDAAAEAVRVFGETLAGVEDGPDPLPAEMLGSAFVASFLREGSSEETSGTLHMVIGRCAELRTRAALTVTLVLSVLAPQEAVRAAAADVAEALVARRGAPPWASRLGGTALDRCVQVIDVFGDQASILCELTRPTGERHGLLVLLDHNGPGPWVADAIVADEVEELRQKMARTVDEAEGLAMLETLTPAEVAPVLREALLRTAQERAAGMTGDLARNWVLATAWLRDVPGRPPSPAPRASEEALEQLVSDFTASEHAQALRTIAGPEIRRIATLLARYGNERDGGRPLRVGPGKTEAVLQVLLDDDVADLAQAGAVVRAWNEWAAHRSGMPAAAVEALVEATDEILERFTPVFGRATRQRHRRDDAAARRELAMPHRSATIRGEVFENLDPEDDDELELLIIGEHPQYQAALADVSSDALVDGVNPRLHIALHQVVAKRLWHDDPPETWRQARRLLAGGMERHDVLHALMDPVAEEIHAALSPELGLLGAMANVKANGSPPGGPRRTGDRRGR